MKYVMSKKYNMLMPKVDCYICNDLGYFTDMISYHEDTKRYCDCKVGKKLKLENILMKK